MAFWLQKLLALLFEVLTFLMDHSLAIGSCNSPRIGDSCDKNIIRAANERGGLSSEAESQAFQHATVICNVFFGSSGAA